MCDALAVHGPDEAARIIQADYGFVAPYVTRRSYGPAEAVSIFVRDGFVDRYSGARLVFSPVLHIIHASCPEVFPHHPAWRSDATHPAFNELAATIDHVTPVTAGGADEPVNWVTTSMARNFAKSNFSLEELGWRLHPPGNMVEWDGLLNWYVAFLRQQPQLRRKSAIGRWLTAAERALAL